MGKKPVTPVEGGTSKARVLTRGQTRTPTGPRQKGATPSWLEGGVGLSKRVIREEQRKDPGSVDAMMWIHNGCRPEKEDILSAGLDVKFLWGNFECLVMVDGLLCRRVGPLMDGSSKTTIYIPPSLRRKAITMCHDDITAGHFYFWKTVTRAKRYFSWAGMTKDVKIHCRACQVCATRKVAGRHQRAEMRHYDVGLPMEEISLDLMGPFPESSAGNKYVVVLVDSFSKWVEAYPIPNIEAKTVAEKVVMEFISRFGVPHTIKSDRGRQFECELFSEMCRLLEVEHRMSTPFHPQGNSKCERMVKVVGNLISSYCRDYKEWDANLPLLTLAYRSTVHEVTGFTPSYIMTGREVLLPLDIMTGVQEDEGRKHLPAYVEELKARLHQCFTEVRQHLRRAAERQKRYYNLHAHGDQHSRGDLVYLKETTRKKGVSPKLAPKWRGPYIIAARFGTVYEVLVSPTTTKVYHFDLLKKCHSDSPPAWIKRALKKLKAIEVQAPVNQRQ